MMAAPDTSDDEGQAPDGRPNQTDHETMLHLWRGLAMHFANYLDTTPPEKRRANMLGQIRQFLKDNDIAADASHKVPVRERLGSLLTLGLPFTAPDGSGH